MKVSIIVPNRNYAEYLINCLDSIAMQTYPNIEVLLADGNSDDGSIEILEKYAMKYGWTIYSREDKGQVDAIDIGLKLAAGDIQCWLNSDDYFLSNQAIEKVVTLFQEFPSVDVVSLGGYYTDAKGYWIKAIKLQTHPLLRQNHLAMRGGFAQPSTFWKPHVFHEIGLVHNLPYSFDTYFFIQASRQFNMLIDQNIIVSGYRLHGSNLSLGVKSKRIRELAQNNAYIFGYGFRYLYLNSIAFIVMIISFVFPESIATKINLVLYGINNFLSYLTIYRIPSI
jgi:glycosyltransferase involved in cell wall biosynthesis